MTRILIHVEGQTEETFTNSSLAPYLYSIGFTNVGARLVGNARARLNRGGIRDWHLVRRDIERHLRGDNGLIAGLMVDYYALPTSWPGRHSSNEVAVGDRGKFVELAILDDFEQVTGITGRFEPHILLHEFEALLFSDCEKFAEAIGQQDKAKALQDIVDKFDTPEHINDHPNTAPSKRMLSVIPGYQKPLFGSVGAVGIGLTKIREKCSSFDGWMARLEARAP